MALFNLLVISLLGIASAIPLLPSTHPERISVSEDVSVTWTYTAPHIVQVPNTVELSNLPVWGKSAIRQRGIPSALTETDFDKYHRTHDETTRTHHQTHSETSSIDWSTVKYTVPTHSYASHTGPIPISVATTPSFGVIQGASTTASAKAISFLTGPGFPKHSITTLSKGPVHVRNDDPKTGRLDSTSIRSGGMISLHPPRPTQSHNSVRSSNDYTYTGPFPPYSASETPTLGVILQGPGPVSKRAEDIGRPLTSSQATTQASASNVTSVNPGGPIISVTHSTLLTVTSINPGGPISPRPSESTLSFNPGGPIINITSTHSTSCTDDGIRHTKPPHEYSTHSHPTSHWHTYGPPETKPPHEYSTHTPSTDSTERVPPVILSTYGSLSVDIKPTHLITLGGHGPKSYPPIPTSISTLEPGFFGPKPRDPRHGFHFTRPANVIPGFDGPKIKRGDGCDPRAHVPCLKVPSPPNEGGSEVDGWVPGTSGP